MYTVIAQNADSYRLRFDASHPIYKAHFPGNPITPGVCILEAVGMLTELKVGRKLCLVRAKSIKFVSTLNPLVTSEAEFKLRFKTDNGQIEVQAIVETAQGVVAKTVTFYE